MSNIGSNYLLTKTCYSPIYNYVSIILSGSAMTAIECHSNLYIPAQSVPITTNVFQFDSFPCWCTCKLDTMLVLFYLKYCRTELWKIGSTANKTHFNDIIEILVNEWLFMLLFYSFGRRWKARFLCLLVCMSNSFQRNFSLFWWEMYTSESTTTTIKEKKRKLGRNLQKQQTKHLKKHKKQTENNRYKSNIKH